VASGATVVHTGEQRGALLAGPAARLAGVPLVWQIHSLEASRAIGWLASLLATTVVVPSSSTSAAVGRLPRRAVVVPNPVVAPPPVTDHLVSEDRSPDRPVVLTCGRLHPVKGYDVLFAAVAILIERQRDLHVVVRGDRQLGHEAHAHALVEQLRNDGLTDVVEFADFGEHPFEAGRGAAVYVQPSRHETFGLAAAEAMAASLPVVASAVGGLAELVDHGRTGLLTPPGDATALADAIERLLDDRVLAARLAAAGKAEVADRFGRGVVAMAEVYERAASRRRRHRRITSQEM
jgi:glycosyltransferase involved in cell wall biosynthesis